MGGAMAMMKNEKRGSGGRHTSAGLEMHRRQCTGVGDKNVQQDMESEGCRSSGETAF